MLNHFQAAAFSVLSLLSACLFADGFYPAKGLSKGGVLLAYHPVYKMDYRLMDTLAKTLSDIGWTVQIQASKVASIDGFAAELPPLFVTLRKKAGVKLVLLTYGIPWEILNAYFSMPQSKQVSGLVLLSAQQLVFNPDKAQQAKTVSLRFPVLDIVAQFDYHVVLDAWKLRKEQAQRDYTAYLLPGAYSGYRYNETLLREVLNDWMEDLPTPKVYQRPQ